MSGECIKKYTDLQLAPKYATITVEDICFVEPIHLGSLTYIIVNQVGLTSNPSRPQNVSEQLDKN
jgi:hypothetical protein